MPIAANLPMAAVFSADHGYTNESKYAAVLIAYYNKNKKFQNFIQNQKN